MYFIGKRCASIQCIVFSSFYRLLSGLQIWKKLILFFFCIIFLRNEGGLFFSFSCIYLRTYKWILMTDKLKTMFYWFSKSQINEGMIRFWYWWESYFLENRQNSRFSLERFDDVTLISTIVNTDMQERDKPTF